MDGALVITGPTGSGKSLLAVELAQHLDIEIISADSAQVYRGMDIGTAKPSTSVLESVRHHLVDIREPFQPYSAADFRSDILRLVPEIIARGRLPVIVGGSMLYLKLLKDGLADLPKADKVIRREIDALATTKGWAAVHKELKHVDPIAALRIKPTDSQRLQRALEVYKIAGTSMTELQKNRPAPCPFPLKEIGIMPPDRSELHVAISNRFHAMLEKGFVEEVVDLKSNPVNHSALPAIRAVGYRQIWSYLEGDINYREMISTSITATKQLAKRQYTWLRNWKGMTYQESANTERVLKII